MKLRVALLATLALLIAHALAYRFLCDDAFISFRYARHLAEGHGLVFNPGFERVEGFTNPLWVLILAALDLVGARPELAANALSLSLTVVLWWLVARASIRLLPPGTPAWIMVLPALWLSITRTIAVWSTSGLETRLFEALVVAGVLRLAEEVRDWCRDETARPPWGAALLGLSVWARPDGLLIGAAAIGAAFAVLVARRRRAIARALPWSAAFLAVIVPLFALRLAYFGAWLPNTYFAKVAGRSWWGMGVAYLGTFVLEYAAWLWIPAIAAGAWALARTGRGEVPALIAAAVIPHALYVASIGGDHFEYRPLDLYVPFAFVLMACGLAAAGATRRARVAAGLYAAAVVLGLVAIPWAAVRQFPRDYIAGFPGSAVERLEASDFLDPTREPWLSIPGVASVAQAHRAATRALTRRFVAIRREEHVLFAESVIPEASRLRELVAGAVLPADTHIAVGCVGLIPYVSELRTFDRFGLTDADVARLPVGAERVMAHEKVATIEMARAKGVDLWAVDPVHLLFRADDPALLARVEEARRRGDDAVVADAGEGWWLLARPPLGVDALRRRVPELTWRAVADDAVAHELAGTVIAAASARVPLDRLRLARALELGGRPDDALPVWRALAATGDPEGGIALARVELGAGRDAEALAALDRVLAARPSAAPACSLRGVILARQDRSAEAEADLRRALREDPEDDESRYTLALVYLVAGRRPDAEREIAVLERRRSELAAKARSATP